MKFRLTNEYGFISGFGRCVAVAVALPWIPICLLGTPRVADGLIGGSFFTVLFFALALLAISA